MKQLYTCLLILISILSEAQTSETCGVPPPAGWVTISINGSCVSGDRLSRIIQRYDNLPTGTELDVCQEAPSGWIALTTNSCFIDSYGNSYLGHRIKKIEGLPTGTELDVCQEAPVGWIALTTRSCFTLNGVNYLGHRIKKIEGLPTGTELDVCQKAPVGWIALTTNSCFTLNGVNYLGHRIKKIDGLPAGTELDVCQDVPEGWIPLSHYICFTLNGVKYHGHRIKKIDGLPAGTELDVCWNTPDGWITVAINGICADTCCSFLGRRIKKIDGLPSGTEVDICGDLPPGGWVTIAVTECEYLDGNKWIGRRIKRIDGLPAGTQLDICGDSPPAGWISLSVDTCETINGTSFAGRRIIRYQGMPYGTILNVCGDGTPSGWILTNVNPNCGSFGGRNYSSFTIQNFNCYNQVSIQSSGPLSCINMIATLTATSDALSPTYKWSGPNNFTSNQVSVDVSLAGVYSVTMIDGNEAGSCYNHTTSVNLIRELPPYTVSVNASGILSCNNIGVTLMATTTVPNPTYKWTGPNNFTFVSTSPTIKVGMPGEYNLTVMSGECSVMSALTVDGSTTGCSNICMSIQTGAWTNSATWACGRVPLSTDRVVLGHSVTIPADKSQMAHELIYITGGRLMYLTGARLKLLP